MSNVPRRSRVKRPMEEKAGRANNDISAGRATIKNEYENLAAKCREYTKTFREWPKEKGHAHDEDEINKLQRDVTRLLHRRSQFWSKNRENPIRATECA